jgi:hypothetical protein
MSATRAFIVRPFGVKEGIDFEEVERKLIAPALQKSGIEGRTTGEITRQGNIRGDMFRLLVLSDIVIADVSIYGNSFPGAAVTNQHHRSGRTWSPRGHHFPPPRPWTHPLQPSGRF